MLNVWYEIKFGIFNDPLFGLESAGFKNVHHTLHGTNGNEVFNQSTIY